MIDAPVILASPWPSAERARVLGSHIVMAGLAADRPPAGQPGRLYFETDTGGGTLFRDSGSSWVQVAPDVSSQVLRKVATGQQNKTNTATLGIDTTLSVNLEANTN